MISRFGNYFNFLFVFPAPFSASGDNTTGKEGIKDRVNFNGKPPFPGCVAKIVR